MASRSGAGAGGSRPNRQRDVHEDFPSLGETLGPLRPFSHGQSPASHNLLTALSTSRASRPTYSAAARRAERIRRLDDRPPRLHNLEHFVNRSLAAHRVPRLRPGPASPQQHQALPSIFDRGLDDGEADSRFAETTDRELAISDFLPTVSPDLSPTLSPTIRPHNFPDDNIRSKRRKIDSNRLVPGFKGFRYGRYGQVESGRLRMEMVSCDGGNFANKATFAVENILRDDGTVYCTGSNRCNIVLRHYGATAFTLEELTIKAPTTTNYSHPVREGMVFVAMNQDESLSRTAKYQVEHTRPSNDRRSRDRSSLSTSPPRQRPARHIISIRHHDNGITSTSLRSSVPSPREEEEYANNESERRMPDLPAEFVENQADFSVTFDCPSDEEEGDDAELYMPPSARPAYHIGSLPFETEISDDDDLRHAGYGDMLTETFHRQLPSISTMNLYAWDRDRDSESERGNHSLPAAARGAEASDAQNGAPPSDMPEGVHASGGHLLVPHAKFFMEKRKSSCTIHFDPPVSGRFILLKVWSPHHDPRSNIDIQSVLVKGYAGPRYFPSVRLS